MKIQNISIFCGAHEGNNPIYAEEAKNIAEVIAKKGINVVFGGGNVGLMKVISNTALDNGVDALGISLKSLYELELVNPRLKEVIVAETLLDRKDVFMDRSDAFIVLPGGVGSLDELAEVMASNQLGIINKPIGILNTAVVPSLSTIAAAASRPIQTTRKRLWARSTAAAPMASSA